MGIHAPPTLSSEKPFLDFGLSQFGVFLDGRTDGLAGGRANGRAGGRRAGGQGAAALQGRPAGRPTMSIHPDTTSSNKGKTVESTD